jgi:hypothetical protein
MESYSTEHRLTERWKALAMAGFYTVATVAVVHEGPREIIGGLPLFALLGYGLAAALRNRIRVVVDSGRIQVENGPLLIEPPTPTVERAQVARVYVRHAYMPSRTGGWAYLAAGVERSDGTWLDLSAPGLPDEDVWRRANQIARSLEWPGPVEELHDRAPKADPRGTRVVWYWTAAGLGAMLWGCAVQVLFVAL